MLSDNNLFLYNKLVNNCSKSAFGTPEDNPHFTELKESP